MGAEKDHFIIMSEHKNKNIAQTTKMTKRNLYPPPSLSNCCFFTQEQLQSLVDSS